MLTGRPWRNTGSLRRALCAVMLVGALAAPASSGAASLVEGSYELDYDQDVQTQGSEVTDIRKFKQILELKYHGFLSPVVANEVSFKIEQERNSDAADVVRFLPMLELAFKGSYWDVKAGVKRLDETSNEPGKNPKTTDNWYAEFFYRAPRRIPDLKAKYTLDTEFEEGTTDTRRQGIVVSSEYKPKDWLEMKGEYSRDTLDDALKPDADTEEEKSTGAVAIRRMISRKIRAEAQYSVELTRGATLLDAGGSNNTKEDQLHKDKTLVAYRPFVSTSLDGTYDYELKQNKVLGEHTLTTNIKAAAAQRIANPLDVRGEFLRVITDNRHTQDDNTKTEDTWTVEVKAVFSKQLDFSLRRQDKHIVEDHVDVTRSLTNSTLNDTVTWTGNLTPFWIASAAYDRIDTFAWDTVGRREVKTTIDTKYNVKSTFNFKAIELTLDPSYDITFKDDRVKLLNSAVRDFKFKIVHRILKTRTVEAKIDHTYGRKTDSGLQNIQRSDSTTGNVTMTDPLPGWLVSFDFIRLATDTSGDDLPADISTTFGVKADYKYKWLLVNTSFKYDKKSLTDDSETLDAKLSWAAPRWDLSLTYTFEKVFAATLDEKYGISLTFKYNL